MLQPLIRWAWVIGALLIVGVAAQAVRVWWRSRRPVPVWEGGNPYPGLIAYEQDRAAVFLGRAEDIRDLTYRVQNGSVLRFRFVPVLGPSGSGKSSLVLAGLQPKLTADGHWCLLPAFTPGSSGIAELGLILQIDASAEAAAAAAAAYTGDAPPPPATVLAALRVIRGTRRRILMIIDQFEEAAIQHTNREQERFLALLHAIVLHEPRLCVVATLRSEWVGHFQRNPGSDLFVEPFMVNVLGPRQFHEVISEPARLTDTVFDDGLIDEIVREAGHGDALPLLSSLLADLYDKAGPDRRITRADYERAGGVIGSIAGLANAAVRELGLPCVEVLDVLLLFVSIDGDQPIRRRVVASALSPLQKRIVDAFVQARLLTSDTNTDQQITYNIAHDALLRQWPPLVAHIEIHKDGLRRITNLLPLAQAWVDSGRHPAYLVPPERLSQVSNISPNQLPVPLPQFILAVYQQDLSDREGRANFAAARAVELIDTDPATAISVALAACSELEPTPLATAALYCALATGLRHVLRCDTEVWGVAFAPDGRLAAGGEDGVARIWDSYARPLHEITGHDGPVTSVAFAPDGRLATAGADHTARIWDADARPLHEITEHDRPVTEIAFAFDGRLATAGEDGTVQIWDANGQLLNVITAHESPVSGVAFASDGRLATASKDGIVRIWDSHARRLHEITDQDEGVTRVAFAVDGRLATAGSYFARLSVRIWAPNGDLLHTLPTHGHVWAIAFTADGRLAAATGYRYVQMWDAAGHLLDEIVDHNGVVTAVTFTADGRLATASEDRTVRVRDSNKQWHRTLTCHDEAITHLALALDGRLVTASEDSTARIWDSHGSMLYELADHDGAVLAVAIAHDGRLATVTREVVRIWDVNGRLLDEITDHDAVIGAAFAPNGQLATTTDNRVCLWDPDGRPLGQVVDHDGPIIATTFAFDGRLAIATERAVQIWDTNGDQCDEIVVDYDATITVIEFAPNGQLAIALTNQTVQIWDVRGQLVYTLTDHDWIATNVAFAPGGQLATTNDSQTIQIWDNNGHLLQKLTTHDPIVDIAFCPDGRWATAGRTDGTVQIWPALKPAAVLIAEAQTCTLPQLDVERRRQWMLPPRI